MRNIMKRRGDDVENFTEEDTMINKSNKGALRIKKEQASDTVTSGESDGKGKESGPHDHVLCLRHPPLLHRRLVKIFLSLSSRIKLSASYFFFYNTNTVLSIKTKLN